MGFYIYVSHKDTVEALVAAKELMQKGHFPFVPQLNRLVAGKTDAEWENYFKMWLFRCDCIYLCVTHRPHEVAWARENKVPVCSKMSDVDNLTLPKFGELGRRFGEQCASLLETNEGWRQGSKEDEVKKFEDLVGLGRKPLTVGVAALKAWDRIHGG
jgi:hypothetical protein